MMSGSMAVKGDHEGSLKIGMVVVTPSLSSRHLTKPLIERLHTKWQYFLLLGIFFMCSEKYADQLYICTNGIPSSHPTTSTLLHLADLVTTSTMSWRVSTGVLRNCCLSNPKQESGENLVCPTTMKDKENESLSPTITLQQRY